MLVYLAMIEEEKYHSFFEALYYTYRSSMLQICKSILHDHQMAEDALSEAFLKIAQNIEKISSISGQERRAYLVTIVRNSAIDLYRKRQADWENTVAFEDGLENVPDGTPEDMVFDQEGYQRLLDAIEALPETYRDTMRLYYVYDHSAAEIAELLHIKESNVAARLSRGRKKLAAALEKEGKT